MGFLLFAVLHCKFDKSMQLPLWTQKLNSQPKVSNGINYALPAIIELPLLTFV